MKIREWRGVHVAIAMLTLSGLVLGGYLWVSTSTYDFGFPLDDAWIHQTYARNFVERGEWAFLPGQPSAGSTAPLWTLLLALGYRLGADPKAWSYAVGGLLLVSTAWVCGRWLADRMNSDRRWMLWVGALVILEWHLAWAAVSGMEILALTCLACVILSRLENERWNPVGFGAAIGLGIWIRPDALSLLLPVGWCILFRDRASWLRIAKDLSAVCIGLAVTMIPYMLFNHQLSSTWWPSTFYAKSAEYAVMREVSFIKRLFQQLMLPFVGVTIVLLPGIILSLLRICRTRAWSRLAPLLWVVGFLTAYAWRLPVTYQHGRYAMPVIPVLLVIGSNGLRSWVLPDSRNGLRRIISRAWIITVWSVALAFLALGMQAYGRDVAIIETEMVQSALWVSTNTESDAIVAAHDIGALGYYADRTLLDLAGLVSPQVIPFIRDEQALEQYLNASGADYLVTFPGWYPRLVLQAEQVYLTASEFSPRAGGENMAVYRWTSEGLPHD